DLSAAGSVGGATAFSAASETASVKVARLLTPVPEDTPTPGDLVSSFTANFIVDADHNSSPGIAVFGVTGADNGRSEHSTNGGMTWSPLGAVTAASARLLGDSDRIRFLPGPNFTGLVSFSYRAWDRMTGTPGGTADLSSPGAVGGATAFSAEQDLAFVQVSP